MFHNTCNDSDGLKSILFLAIFSLTIASFSSHAADYHVDSVSGNDGSELPTEGQPWKNLTKVNSAITAGTIQSGDRILLKRGSVWTGQTLNLTKTGGLTGVTVDAYGNSYDPLPVIDGSAFLQNWSVYRTPPEQVQNATVFKSGWESGDYLDNGTWTLAAGNPGMLSLSSVSDTDIDSKYGVITGNHSLRIEKQGTTQAYIETANTGAPGDFYLRFTFRHIGRQVSDNSATGTGYSIAKLLRADGVPVVDIGFSGGEDHNIYFACHKPNGSGTSWSYPLNIWASPTFDGRPHIIELHYKPGGDSQLRFDGRMGHADLDKIISGCSESVTGMRLGIMNGPEQRPELTLSAAGNDVFWIDDVAIGPDVGWLGSPAPIYQAASTIQGAGTSSKRRGQVWEFDSKENLNNGDRRKAGLHSNVDLQTTDVNYLMPGEFELTEDGIVFVAPRNGLIPTDTSYLLTSQKRGIDIYGNDISVRNVRIQYQWEYGIYAGYGSNNISIEDTQIHRVNRIGIRVEGPGSNINIRNNQVWEIGGLWGRGGAGFGIHLSTTDRAQPLTGITVADNTLWDIGAATDGDCCGHPPSNGWGIEVDEDTTQVIVERNRIFLQAGSRQWWEVLRHAWGDGLHFEYFDNPGAIGELVVRNNLIVDLPIGMSFHKFNTGASVYNNTIIVPQHGYYYRHQAFRFGSDPLASNGGTAGDKMDVHLRNNLVYMRPDVIPGLPDARLVMNVLSKDLDNSVFSSDYNLAFHPNSVKSVVVGTRSYTHTHYLDWLEWSSAVGGEIHSLAPSVDPMLSTAEYALLPGSRAHDAGEDVGQPYAGVASDIGYLEGEIVVIPDADMEAVDTTAWTGVGATLSKSLNNVRADKRALRIDSSNLNQGNRARTAPITVQPGEVYRVSGWAYATDLTYSNSIVVRDLTTGQYLVNPFSNGSNVVQTANKWQYLESSFTIPAGTSSIEIWLMNRNHQNKPNYFDDIRLVRLSAN